MTDHESPDGVRMGVKRSFLFLVTLLTVVMVALPMLYRGSPVDSGQDTSPPDTQITVGPDGTVDDRDVTFCWTGWDDTTSASQLEYSFNLQGYDMGWSDWASATTNHYADLHGGSYIFTVQARDQAGNIDPTPAETAFYVSWTFAVLTDLHIGNGISDYGEPGYNDSGTPLSGEAAGYAQDAVNEINKIADSQNIAFVAVLGDLTDSAEASELRAARLILDNLTIPWIPVMGNHDTWPMTDNQLAPLGNPPSESYFDSIIGPEYSILAAQMSGWGKQSPALVYDPEAERDTYFENFFFDYGGFHFVCLDFNSRLGYRAGDLHDFAGGTWSWFKQHMEQYVQQNAERSGDVILLAHHPIIGDGSDNDTMTFTSAELDEISNFTNNTYYSYLDSSGITQTRPYASRIWGQLAGHTHPWKLQIDYPPWSNGGPIIAYPRNFGEVRIGMVKVTSDTPASVDYSIPTVATEAATSMSLRSATLNGYLASRGASPTVQVFFEWGLATSYGHETTPQSISEPGSFSFDLTGLTARTTYHFRAKAVGNGTSPGSDMIFTTAGIPPTVATNDATNLAGTSATLNGTLSALGTATSANVSFEWGLTATYGHETTPQSMSGPGSFSYSLTGLTAKTTYHFRAKALGNGATTGSDMALTTSTIPPSVTTNDATNLAATSAALNGTLTSLGTATSANVSFEWGLTASYGHETTPQPTSGPGSFNCSLIGLSVSTTYHFRVKAAGDGAVYGNDVTFTTLAAVPPAVVTNDDSSITTNSARLNGTLTSLGTTGSVTVSFEWGTTAGGPYLNETAGQVVMDTEAFSFDLGGLTPGTTYYYRAKAEGDGTSHGAENSLTPATSPPAAATNNASNVTTNSARLNATLTSMGTAGSANVSFEWGLTSSYGHETTPRSMSEPGGFSYDLTGLTANTTYHFRVEVVGDGAVYGDDMNFTTGSAAYTPPPAFPVAPPPDTTAPAISAATSSDITVSGVTIAWTTNEPATCRVEYGLTAGYGLDAITDAGLANSHRVELAGLEAGKTYHYRVIAIDGSNNQAVSADITFSTDTRPDEKRTWAWLLIGLVAAVGLGGTVSSQRADMYQEALLRRLEVAMGRVYLLERERNAAAAKLQSMERNLNELSNVLSLAGWKADEILKGGPASDMSKRQLTPTARLTSPPPPSEGPEKAVERSASRQEELRRRFPHAFTLD